MGQVVSEIGDWLNNIAVLALVIELAPSGREGLAIAIYAVSRHLPIFMFGPFAGVVADRLDRRRIMIGADVVRAFLALGFLTASILSSLLPIYFFGGALLAVAVFFNAAKRAAIPNVVVKHAEGLLTANALSASTTAATIAIGSAFGGIVSTVVGRNLVFIINALTFLLSAEIIRRIKGPTSGARTLFGEPGNQFRTVEPAKPARGLRNASVAKLFREIIEGLRYVKSRSMLFAIFVVAAGWGLGNGAARALYSIFGARLGEAAVAGLIERPTDFGISVLFVAMGLGGVLGAPIARRFNAGSTESLGARMGRSMIFDGIGLGIFSFAPNLWFAASVLVLREINFAIWWTAQQTMLMTATEDRYSGRVFASYETLTTLMMVGSMLVSGAAADAYGITLVAGLGGLIIFLSGVSWFLMRRPDRPGPAIEEN